MCFMDYATYRTELPIVGRVRLLHLAIGTITVFLVLYIVFIVPRYTKVDSELKRVAIPTLGIIYESGHVSVDFSSFLCPRLGTDLKVLMVIASAPWNETARMDIRYTWRHYAAQKNVAIGFILGSTTNDTLKDSIDKEQDMYGDLIRGKFVDNIENLTLKTISMLEWVMAYCPRVTFVFKAEDDMFINIPGLLTFISKCDPKLKAIYGRIQKETEVTRNKTSKYYISNQEYHATAYPEYITGASYLFATNLSEDLYFSALFQPYLRIEDVFLTGFVANYLNINRIRAPEFHMERERQNDRPALTLCRFLRGVSVHLMVHEGEKHFDLWKKLSAGNFRAEGEFSDCKMQNAELFNEKKYPI